MPTSPARPILTIAVPTYNRHKYLVELLPELIHQAEQGSPGRVEILLVDNASTDATAELVANHYATKIRYQCNARNIGADRNFVECIRSAQGNYVWLFGDDEVLNPGGVQRVLQALEGTPDLLIAESDFEQTMQFPSYRDLLLYESERNPHLSGSPHPDHEERLPQGLLRPRVRACASPDQLRPYVRAAPKPEVGAQDHRPFRPGVSLSCARRSGRIRRLPTDLDGKLIELSSRMADALDYPALHTNIWLFFKMRPLYKLRHSRKVRKLIKLFA